MAGVGEIVSQQIVLNAFAGVSCLLGLLDIVLGRVHKRSCGPVDRCSSHTSTCEFWFHLSPLTFPSVIFVFGVGFVCVAESEKGKWQGRASFQSNLNFVSQSDDRLTGVDRHRYRHKSIGQEKT